MICSYDGLDPITGNPMMVGGRVNGSFSFALTLQTDW